MDELGALYDANLDACYEFEILNNKICFKKAFKRVLKDDAKTAATGLKRAYKARSGHSLRARSRRFARGRSFSK